MSRRTLSCENTGTSTFSVSEAELRVNTLGSDGVKPNSMICVNRFGDNEDEKRTWKRGQWHVSNILFKRGRNSSSCCSSSLSGRRGGGSKTLVSRITLRALPPAVDRQAEGAATEAHRTRPPLRPLHARRYF